MCLKRLRVSWLRPPVDSTWHCRYSKALRSNVDERGITCSTCCCCCCCWAREPRPSKSLKTVSDRASVTVTVQPHCEAQSRLAAAFSCSQQAELRSLKNSSRAMQNRPTLIVDAASESLRREKTVAGQPAGSHKDLLHFLTRSVALIQQPQHNQFTFYRNVFFTTLSMQTATRIS